MQMMVKICMSFMKGYNETVFTFVSLTLLGDR